MKSIPSGNEGGRANPVSKVMPARHKPQRSGGGHRRYGFIHLWGGTGEERFSSQLDESIPIIVIGAGCYHYLLIVMVVAGRCMINIYWCADHHIAECTAT